MATGNSPGVEPTEQALTIERIIDAPRELAFEAWIDPALMRQWSAPRGYTITRGSEELRPGGAWRCCMRSPEGVDYWLGGVYREIVPPERLAFTHAWDSEDGKPGHETRVTVSFADLNGKTLITFHQEGFESRESRDGHEGGWRECLDQLAELLAKVGAKRSIS